MDTQERQNKLLEFIAALPDSVRQAFQTRGDFDVLLAISEIGDKFELIITEIHLLYEAVRRVLAGEDTPANLVAFISQDQNIEEDNRPKIPAIAAEIQQKIFDPVLPILKRAGMTVKEGRVAQGNIESRIPNIEKYTNQISQKKQETTTPLSPPLTRFAGASARREGGEGSASVSVQSASVSGLDEKHLRALLRIAAGTDYTEEKLREAFEDLPEGLKRAVSSVDTANAVQEIAKKFLLHIDQMAALASETGLVLLGITHPVYYVANLTSRLKVPQQKALEIARDVSSQVLSKVKDALRGLHEKPAESSKFQVPSSKQIPSANTQTQKITSSTPSSAHIGVPSAPSASVTPYSPEAKWNMEVPNNQSPRDNNQTSGEEKLTREEVLRGIEQPTNVQPTPAPTTPPPAPLLRKGGGEERVGPTGWKPPQSGMAAAGQSPTTPPPAGGSPPQQRRGGGDFLEQKLSQPMGLPREERRYTIDPYREQIE